MKLVQLAFFFLVLVQQPASRVEVRVHLMDGLNGQPVPRVRYALTGGGMADGVTGNGDPQGNVALADLAPGRYQITVDKAGYFQERVDFNVTGAPVDLPGITLTAKREISGIVRWQDGEPAARAQIRVLGVRGGKIAPGSREVASASVNDRGEFVVTNLRPGRYVLAAYPPPFLGGIDANGQFVAGGAPRISSPVFFPGVTAPDPRASIDVRAVVNVQNVGIVFEEKPGTTVEGLVSPSPTAPAGADVSITLTNPGLTSTSIRARAGTPFRLGPVPSGFYVLDAQSAGAGQQGRTLLTLTVGGSILSGVTVSIPPPSVLSGNVEIDNPAVRPAVRVTIQSDRIPGAQASTSNDMGEFRIPSVIAGETYGMTVTLPPGFSGYIASVSQNDREKAVSPFQIAATTEPVKIVVKTDGGTIEGVAKESGRVLPQAFIVLAPKDRKVEQNFRIATAGNDGTFRLPAIPPGDYDLLAFDRNEDDDYLDELFLRPYEERAVSIKVAPRSTQTQELAVQRIPRR